MFCDTESTSSLKSPRTTSCQASFGAVQPASPSSPVSSENGAGSRAAATCIIKTQSAAIFCRDSASENGGAFVIKCTEDRGKPLLMFLDGEEGVKPTEGKLEGAADPERVAQLEAALASEKAEKEAALAEKDAALAEKGAELAKEKAAVAEKDAELASLREMIAERQRWRAQSPKAGAVRDPTGTA